MKKSRKLLLFSAMKKKGYEIFDEEEKGATK
jgi:hypothetical protein